MDINEALRELLPGEDPGQEATTDALIAAAREAWRRRHINTQAGGAVLAALNAAGMSYRQIAAATDIPAPTAQRWAKPPDETQ